MMAFLFGAAIFLIVIGVMLVVIGLIGREHKDADGVIGFGGLLAIVGSALMIAGYFGVQAARTLGT